MFSNFLCVVVWVRDFGSDVATAMGQSATMATHTLDIHISKAIPGREFLPPFNGLQQNSFSLFHKPIQVLNNLDQSDCFF